MFRYVCVHACARMCVYVCVHACMRASVCVHAGAHVCAHANKDQTDNVTWFIPKSCLYIVSLSGDHHKSTLGAKPATCTASA